MRGCALRKVVRNLAHKKLENRGVEPQHLPSQMRSGGRSTLGSRAAYPGFPFFLRSFRTRMELAHFGRVEIQIFFKKADFFRPVLREFAHFVEPPMPTVVLCCA